MIYDPSNARGAHVYDVESGKQLTHVLWVDTEAGEVVRAHQPYRVVGGHVATYSEKFTTIYPIHGNERMVQLFHCYGRK